MPYSVSEVHPSCAQLAFLSVVFFLSGVFCQHPGSKIHNPSIFARPYDKTRTSIHLKFPPEHRSRKRRRPEALKRRHINIKLTGRL